MKLLESGQMYLETILILGERLETVRSVDVCEYMRFSKPSVSRAMSRLKNDGYITVDRSGHISLTESGRATAVKIYERHRLLCDVLVDLGVKSETAEADACKIEHDLSDETMDVIRAFYAARQEKNG